MSARMPLLPVWAAIILLFAYAPAAHAAIIFETGLGSTQGGQSINARATFTISANTVVVFLENLQVDIRSAGQALSGLQFHLSTNQNKGTLTSSSGRERTVNADGTFFDGNVISTGWALGKVGNDLKLNLLGTMTAPENQLIGPPGSGGIYTGNSSIRNGPHNPHLGLNATFVMNVPGVTTASTITSAMFQFNTSAGSTTTGQRAVPEPASAALALAALGIASLRRRAS